MGRAPFQDWLLWLEQSPWAVAIRKSLWWYPGLEIVHLLGIAIVAGAAFMFDLRLLGFSPHLPLEGLARHLLTWSKRGLLLVIPSGLLLFSTNAESLGQDPTFWLKMGLLLCAGLNAGVFHQFTWTPSKQGRKAAGLPWKAKAAAIISMLVWMAIIACGRLLAY
ncbi:MAG: DUF6644 family protein [Adhaeribacter sp.]